MISTEAFFLVQVVLVVGGEACRLEFVVAYVILVIVIFSVGSLFQSSVRDCGAGVAFTHRSMVCWKRLAVADHVTYIYFCLVMFVYVYCLLYRCNPIVISFLDDSEQQSSAQSWDALVISNCFPSLAWRYRLFSLFNGDIHNPNPNY
ncbi:unnamed protein product [Choristocarpus tenellus]